MATDLALAVLGLLVVVAAGYGLFMAPKSRIFGHYPYRAATTDKVIALTFDDGPNEPYTSQIAEILQARGIRATFFQVGRCVQRHPGTTAALYQQGHVIGNHSDTHRFQTYLMPRRFRREIVHSQEVLRGVLGRTPALARTPWLWRTPGTLRVLRRGGLYAVAGLFAHPAEVFQPDAARIARHAISRSNPGSILIFHDGFDGKGGPRGQTVAAVALVADALIDRGYRFVTVDELFGVEPYHDIEPRPTSQAASG